MGQTRVQLVSDHGSRDTIVELDGLAPAEIGRRLDSARLEGGT